MRSDVSVSNRAGLESGPYIPAERVRAAVKSTGFSPHLAPAILTPPGAHSFLKNFYDHAVRRGVFAIDGRRLVGVVRHGGGRA